MMPPPMMTTCDASDITHAPVADVILPVRHDKKIAQLAPRYFID
jgi:hypothetical protein